MGLISELFLSQSYIRFSIHAIVMQHRKAIMAIFVAATILIPLVALTQQVDAQNSSFTTYNIEKLFTFILII